MSRRKQGKQSQISDSDEDYETVLNEFGTPVPTVSTEGWEDYRSANNRKLKQGGKEPTPSQRKSQNTNERRKKTDEKPAHAQHNVQNNAPVDQIEGGEYVDRGRGQLPLLTAFQAAPVSHTGQTQTGQKTIRTVFAKESDEEIAARRAAARLPLHRCSEAVLSKKEKPMFKMAFGAPESPQFSKTIVDIPQRPDWSSAQSKAQLHAQEEEYFKDYLTEIYSKFGAERLNHFEHNLDVWRQLWRVSERSNLVILTADSRHPLLHFNIGLYRYVVEVLKKPLVLLLNKIDLVPFETLRRWQKYFQRTYPQLNVVVFSSFPTLTQRVALNGFLEQSSQSDQTEGQDQDQDEDEKELDLLLEELSRLSMESSHSELTSHAKAVAKLKKSPTLDPVGVEQLFEACRRILRDFSATQDNASHDLLDSLNLNATRLRTEKDEVKRAAHKASLQQQIQKLRQQLDKFRAYKAEKAQTGQNSSDVLDLKDFDEDENEDQHLDLKAQREMLQSVSKTNDSQKSVKGRGKGRGKARRGGKNDSDSDSEAISPADLLSMPSGRRARLKASAGIVHHSNVHEQQAESSEDEDMTGHSQDEEERSNEMITIGTVGHPNAGKSSVINAITGKKVVSVSRQPGHTKIFQTLKINETTILCDCPGLVFPAVDIPRPLQVLAGIYPIPQTREPFSAVQYLAECLPLEDILGLTPPGPEYGYPVVEPGEQFPWSSIAICEAYALKRGFTASFGRLDANRAAQVILYAVADGKIPFYFEPPTIDGDDE